MHHLMLATISAVALIGGGAMAIDAARTHLPVTPAGYTDEADRPAERIVVGIDLSKSNPLIDDPQFAAKVGARVADLVNRLGPASEVHVRTFGTFDATSNPFYYDIVISRFNRPEDVSRKVERLIASTPTFVANGTWKAQRRTNILAFLDNVARSQGCGGLPTPVVLATDAIEDSQFASLDDPADHLPDPDGKPFAGCAELQILGVGEGTKS